MEVRASRCRTNPSNFFGRAGIDFASLFSKSGCDLLRPLGEYVGVTATADDARFEEEDSVPLFIGEEVSESASLAGQSDDKSEEQSVHDFNLTQEAEADDSVDIPLGMNFDDFLPDTTEGIEQTLTEKHSLKL